MCKACFNHVNLFWSRGCPKDWILENNTVSSAFELLTEFTHHIPLIPRDNGVRALKISANLRLSAAMFLSCRAIPTLLLNGTLDSSSITGCHTDATDDSNEQIELSVWVTTFLLMYDHLVKCNCPSKLIYLLPHRNKIHSWIHQGVQHYFTPWRCKKHDKLICIIDKKLQIT